MSCIFQNIRLCATATILMISLPVTVNVELPHAHAANIGAPAFLEKANPHERLVVDITHMFASNGNPGTLDLPLRTIAKAVDIAKLNRKNGISTKVIIKPGTYRESIDLIFQQTASVPTNEPIIMIEGEEQGVIISGSDIWHDWQATSQPNVFVHAWPYRWGSAPFPSNWPARLDRGSILRRREMVYINKLPLKQVLSKNKLVRGSFYVAEDEQQIYVSPRKKTKLEESLVEVAVRPKLLTVNGTSNIVLRRLIFQHATSPIQESAANFADLKNLLLEDCWFRWNNWTGYQFFNVEHVTSRRNAANYNGGAGIVGTQIRSLLSEDDLTSYNNWRGARGGLFFWAVSGAKYLGVHEAIIRRQRAISNHAGGFWFDTDNRDIVVEQCRWCGNLQYGLFIEASQGPIRVMDSKIYHNEWVGLHLMTSENITLEQNQIFDNSGAALSVARTSKRTIQNWETRQLLDLETGGWTLRHNILAGSNLLMVIRAESFINTLNSDQNSWIRPQADIGFLAREHSSNQAFNFSEWQQTFHHGAKSSFHKVARLELGSVPDCTYEMIPYWIGLQHSQNLVQNRSDHVITVK